MLIEIFIVREIPSDSFLITFLFLSHKRLLTLNNNPEILVRLGPYYSKEINKFPPKLASI